MQCLRITPLACSDARLTWMLASFSQLHACLCIVTEVVLQTKHDSCLQRCVDCVAGKQVSKCETTISHNMLLPNDGRLSTYITYPFIASYSTANSSIPHHSCLWPSSQTYSCLLKTTARFVAPAAGDGACLYWERPSFHLAPSKYSLTKSPAGVPADSMQSFSKFQLAEVGPCVTRS